MTAPSLKDFGPLPQPAGSRRWYAEIARRKSIILADRVALRAAPYREPDEEEETSEPASTEQWFARWLRRVYVSFHRQFDRKEATHVDHPL